MGTGKDKKQRTRRKKTDVEKQETLRKKNAERQRKDQAKYGSVAEEADDIVVLSEEIDAGIDKDPMIVANLDVDDEDYCDVLDETAEVPPPSYLYWRVRAVFAMYGAMLDSKTGKPLFNAKAWSKANGVLREILKGYYSDPPGVSMYNKRTRKDG
eukprot:scaffold48632_cov22-Cyclotella_meneghiniana.AAC.1